MARELLRSVEGRQLPNLGEVAVYWPAADFTNIFDTTGFEFTDEPNETGGVTEYPELIEHDAVATAGLLLVALLEVLPYVPGYTSKDIAGRPHLVKAMESIKSATGRVS